MRNITPTLKPLFLRGIATALAVACLPLVTALCFHLPRVALGNFTDSVFYLSYARQFSELVLRNGFLYYATRFGGILPDALSGHLFGEITGIWVLRWILAAAVSAALFLSFRKRYGMLSGLLASVLWSFNPAALRLICTTYVDSTSVPFLILGCCLVIGDVGIIGSFMAGILFGMASSAHLYAAFALVLLTPWMIGSHWANRGGLIRVTIWAFAGFLVTWFLGWLWYAWVWNMPALLSPTIELLKDLGGGQAALWKKPTALALHEAPAWFAPVALLPLCCMAAWKGSALMRGTACSLLGSTLFFWGGDLFGKAYVLSMPFYYSFLLPVVILASATLCSEIVGAQSPVRLRYLVSGALALAAIVPALSAAHSLERIPLVYGGLAGVLLLLLVAWKNLSKRFLVTLSVAAIGASVWMTASTGIFRQILGHYQSKDIPVMELATALRREVPTAWSDTKVTRFWYDDDPAKPGGSDRRMIGSFWLHTFGKLTGEKESLVPFSIVTASDADAITSSGVERIVIFDQDSAEVDEALKKIEERRIPCNLSKRVTLHSGSDSQRMLEVAILERRDLENHGEITVLDLGGIRCGGHEKLKLEGGKAQLTMSSNKWWNQAKLLIPPMKSGDRLRMRVRIESGFIRFILGDEALQFEEHTDRWTSDGMQEVVLTTPRDLPHPELDVRSLYPNHSQSSLVLEVVGIEKPIQ